jgi:hypothetical protein
VRTASARLLLQRGLARGEERLTPGGETGGRDPQCTRHRSERFPTPQTEDDRRLRPCGTPRSFLPTMLAPLSSRSMRSWRGELYGECLWMPLDTSSE